MRTGPGLLNGHRFRRRSLAAVSSAAAVPFGPLIGLSGTAPLARRARAVEIGRRTSRPGGGGMNRKRIVRYWL
ncbi:MAG: hypothetical protein DLM56_06015 [Pseudonocardiales bacterium]|nr:MAG: hypothetical protein DLM56_06015 [Pseudonocardiales bacterium]